MKKNKRRKIHKIIALVIVLGLTGFMAGRVFQRHIYGAKFFTVKTVICTGAFKALLKDDCDCYNLQGKNLFAVDIKHLARDLKMTYPYLTGIRVSRIIPDKIWLDGQERVAVARVRVGGRIFLCDQDAAILPWDLSRKDLVLISGTDLRLGDIRLGEENKSKELKAALSLLNEINKTPELKGLSLERIEVADPLGVSLFLENGVKVIVGDEMINRRLRVLSIVLKNLKSELGTVRYIDLRFPEPAIGKR